MNLRYPVRAGSFYESGAVTCRHHAVKLLESASLPPELPSRLYGGLVPHAGWSFSGHLAAMTFKAILTDGEVRSVVLLGADHCSTVRMGEVYNSGAWRTPLGDVLVDDELAEALLQSEACFRPNPQAHAYEHSLEVQIPLIQVLSPQARIVPVGVPSTAMAVEIGRAIGRVLAKRGGDDVAVVGSSDLTHHAGHFPAPGGRGIAGVQWTEANDRRMLDLVEKLAAEKVIGESQTHENACGAGAIAAAVAAAKTMGAERGILLDYTNSYRVIHQQYPDEPDDTTVGYASVVFA